MTQRLAERCATVDAVDAADTSPAMLAKLRAKIEERAWLHVRALDALPDPDQPYDVVVCSSVFGFVADLATRTAIEWAVTGAGLVGGAVEPAFTIEAEGEQMRPLCAWSSSVEPGRWVSSRWPP